MKDTLVIARRELVEKRFVFLAAIAFAVLALIIPWLPGVHAGERRGALVMASLILCTGFTVGLAAILGSTIVGRELSDGRLSFYFAKPLSAPSIWFGKVIAATLLVVLSLAIIGGPAFVTGVGSVVRTWTNLGDALPTAQIILATAAAFFLLGHVIGTLVRSRSPWLVVDFVAAAICGWTIWLMIRPLRDGFAFELMQTFAKALGLLLAVVIIGAGAWQLSRGRTDRKRSHREMSRFLWSAFGAGLLVAAVFIMWVVSAKPADLIANYGEQASGSSWAFMSGKAKNRGDYHASFLYDLDTNRYVRVAVVQEWWGGSSFSRDGKTALSLRRATGGAEICVTRLDGAKPKTVTTGITFVPGSALLSDDATRAIVIERSNILTVYDLASTNSLGSVRAPAPIQRVTFPSPDTLRMYAREYGRDQTEKPVRIFEYSISRRALRQTGELASRTLWLRFNDDGSKVLIKLRSGEMAIADARTGALVTNIPSNGYAMFLRDGRIVAADQGIVRIFAADGSAIREIAIPASEAFLRAEIGSGHVVVATRGPGVKPWGVVVVDVDRGSVVRSEPGLVVTARGPLSAREVLCMTTSKDLVAWNPATGAKRIISSQ